MIKYRRGAAFDEWHGRVYREVLSPDQVLIVSARAGSLIVEVRLEGLGDDDALRRVLATLLGADTVHLLDEGVFGSNEASGAARKSGAGGVGAATTGLGVAPHAPAPRAGAVPPSPALVYAPGPSAAAPSTAVSAVASVLNACGATDTEAVRRAGRWADTGGGLDVDEVLLLEAEIANKQDEVLMLEAEIAGTWRLCSGSTPRTPLGGCSRPVSWRRRWAMHNHLRICNTHNIFLYQY